MRTFNVSPVSAMSEYCDPGICKTFSISVSEKQNLAKTCEVNFAVNLLHNVVI